MPLFTPSETFLGRMLPRHREVLARVRTYRVERSDDPLFELAYRGLHDHFGADGQIEERDVLARLVNDPIDHEGVRVAYPLLVVFGEDDQLAGVLSRYVSYEPQTHVLAGLDGNGFIAWPYRRLGIASFSMPLLVEAGRQRLGAPEQPPPTVLDVGDLSLVDAQDRPSVERAVVWGRSGGSVIPPEVFPLSLVGMKDPDAPDGVAPPVPILAFLRSGDGSPTQPTAVDKSSLHAIARHFEAAHSWAAEGAGLAAETARLHAAIEAAPEDPVALLPLPTSLEDVDRIQALFGLVHPLQRVQVQPAG